MSHKCAINSNGSLNTSAKSCRKSFTLGTACRRATSVALLLLLASGCCVLQHSGVAAFTSNSVSSFARFRNHHQMSSSQKKMLRDVLYDYEGEDEGVGPFFFSGEPEVNEKSVTRLETLFKTSLASSQAIATSKLVDLDTDNSSETSSSVSSSNNFFSGKKKEGISMPATTTPSVNPEQPFFFSRDASMDERIIRLRGIIEMEYGGEVDDLGSWQ